MARRNNLACGGNGLDHPILHLHVQTLALEGKRCNHGGRSSPSTLRRRTEACLLTLRPDIRFTGVNGFALLCQEAEHDVAEHGGRGTGEVPKSQTRLRFFVDISLSRVLAGRGIISIQMLSLRTRLSEAGGNLLQAGQCRRD